MKIIKAHSYSYAGGVLILLCQFLCFTISHIHNQNRIGRNLKGALFVGDANYEVPRVEKNNESSGKSNIEAYIRDSTTMMEQLSMVYDDAIDRGLADSFGFNSSDSAEHSNSTASIDDDEIAEILTISGNQSEELPGDNSLTTNPGPTHGSMLSGTAESAKEIPSSNINKMPTGPISGSILPEPIQVTSTVKLELVGTRSLMNKNQQDSFLEVTIGFLSFHLFKKKFMPSLVESEGIDVSLIQQTRSLGRRFLQHQNDYIEEPLYVSFQVTGMINSVGTVASNSNAVEDNLGFEQVLEKIFVEKEGEYLQALKFVDDNYFSSLNRANIFLDQEANLVNNEDGGSKVKGNGFIEEDTTESPLPSIFPWAEETDTMTEIVEVQGGALSQGVIIGITSASVALLVMIAVLICFFSVKTKNRSDGIIDKNNNNRDARVSRRKSSSSRKTNTWIQRSRRKRPEDLIAEENLLATQQPPSEKERDFASNNDLESQAMYSYNQSHGSSGSVYTSGSNVKIPSNQSNAHGSDTMSYAYSLEPGIEASVGSGMKGSFLSHDNGSDVPIREIPQVNMASNKKDVRTDCTKLRSQNKESNATDSHFGNTKIGTAPCELKLTKSELEMLPSNLRSIDDEGDSDDKKVNDDFKVQRVTRKVAAPAGKLGVVIDTTIEGPVVHSVNQSSQLLGKIFPGDIIIAIDEVDTRAMSASDITAVMVKTAKQNRTLTVRGIS